MAAYTALRMGRRNFAIIFYIRVIRRLRNILSQKDADMMGNQVRLWSTVLYKALRMSGISEDMGYNSNIG